MKNKILPIIALSGVLFSSGLQAQVNRAFAVTSDVKGTYYWNSIREIDLTSGEVIKTFYDKALHPKFEIVSKQKQDELINAAGRSSLRLTPMADGVAATAYDARHNRLYYTTMRGTELRYFDLSSASGKIVYHETEPLFSASRGVEANVITRMTIGADGAGYALTNDGKNLVRFTTGQKTVITNLGSLVDGKDNGTISIHNLCSSWGGDMVGDAYGNLYLVSMRNHLFKINPQTRVADHLGLIKGLPADFTSNGMAVDADGNALLSSATFASNYYRLNIGTLEATPVKNSSSDKIFNASDLASSYLLYQNKNIAPKITPEVLGNEMVSVFPNPVANKMLTVKFDKVPAGRYNLLLLDASGKGVLSRSLVINAFGQVERINLPKSAAGMYMLKLTGDNRKTVYNNKIVVQ